MLKKGWVLRGYVPLGAPWSRRLCLSYLSLRAARLPFLAGRLGGVLASSWTSVFGFQRPLIIVLDELFLLPKVSPDTYHPLTPKQAGELVLSAVLAPLAESNLLRATWRRPSSRRSSRWTPPLRAVRSATWTCQSPSRRPPGRMAGGEAATLALRRRPAWRSAAWEASRRGWKQEEPFEEPGRDAPPREVAMVYDFLEVAGGAGGMGGLLRTRGYAALNVDLALSRQFDMQDDVPLRWVIHMLERRRVGVIFLEPPCTDFSCAKHPASRSYDLPRGPPPIPERTRRATRLALRMLSLLFVAV